MKKQDNRGFAQILVLLAIVGLILFIVFSNSITSAAVNPPATWQEHWFDQNQLVSLVYSTPDVAIYYDSDMDRLNTTWLNTYIPQAWLYAKNTYNLDTGNDPHLYAVFHQGKYFGGHPSYYFDSSHDFRNVIVVGAGTWYSTPTGWPFDATSHEIGHIVETVNNGAQGSPTFSLWKDSKWNEIFQYDLYTGLGMQADADRWYDQMVNVSDDFPAANSHWFRDWYYPIWRDYGHTKVLTNYFYLLSRYFPKNGVKYARDLNWGEYIWFMSAAAQADLKPLATSAFTWQPAWETQYQKAKTDFPNMTNQIPSIYLPGDGLNAIYFKDKNLTTVGITRVDPQINFNWNTSSPDPVVPSDNFSARWSGFLRIPGNLFGNLTLYTKSDDGVKVWVNNQLIINRWFNQSASSENSGSISNLQAGQIYPIKVEYFDGYGTASIELRFGGPGVTKQLIPQANLYTADPSLTTPTPSPSGSAGPSPSPTIVPVPIQTPTPNPTTPSGSLTFSAVTATNISDVGATITWDTSIPGSSKVIYGKSSTVLSSSTPDDTTLTLNHSRVLTNLSRNATYYYQVQSKDSSGTLFTSTIQNFKTKASP